MHPCKKLKTDSTVSSDPFGDEEDWEDDDDIMQLVANEVPTYSQISQVITAAPINRGLKTSTNDLSSNEIDSSLLATNNNKPRTFMFKRPSTGSTLLSSKPVSYTAIPVKSDPIVPVPVVLGNPSSDSNIPDKSQTSCLVQLNGTTEDNSLDISTLHKQVSDLIRKQHAHEGEIKWLRTALKEKENQVNNVRVTVNAEVAKQKLQHSEKERAFIKDIEVLRSELQFKESELVGVSQSLDKLKREKQKPIPPVMKLSADGFPAAIDAFIGTSTPSRLAIKTKSISTTAQPMEITAAAKNSVAAPPGAKCDLKPVLGNRLVPRRLSSSEYKRKSIMAEMLRSNMEIIKQILDSSQNTAAINKVKCQQLLSGGIEYTIELSYM